MESLTFSIKSDCSGRSKLFCRLHVHKRLAPGFASPHCRGGGYAIAGLLSGPTIALDIPCLTSGLLTILNTSRRSRSLAKQSSKTHTRDSNGAPSVSFGPAACRLRLLRDASGQ